MATAMTAHPIAMTTTNSQPCGRPDSRTVDRQVSAGDAQTRGAAPEGAMHRKVVEPVEEIGTIDRPIGTCCLDMPAGATEDGLAEGEPTQLEAENRVVVWPKLAPDFWDHDEDDDDWDDDE